MKILVVPAQYKETLTATAASKIMQNVAGQHGHEVIAQPVSDGGEGFLEPFLTEGGRSIPCKVRDPLGRTIDSSYVLQNDRAIIEMAKASGIELVKPNERDILNSSTFGTGELIRDALLRGARTLIISLGGSATNDGGMGMMRALDVNFLSGKRLIQKFNESCEISDIDLSGLYKIIDKQKFIGACDVTNPLLGSAGSTEVYSEQKGASEDQKISLERYMRCYSDAVHRVTGMDCRDEKGSGAAGGTGFALTSFLGAQLQPGFDILAELLGLEDLIRWSDVVVTGEGKLDRQTQYGKAPSRIREMATDLGKPVIAIVGADNSSGNHGFDAVYSLTDLAGSSSEAIKEPKKWLTAAVSRFVRDFE